MRTAVSLASTLACAFAAHAQITATLTRLPNDRQEIRLRNNSTQPLAAFVVSAKSAHLENGNQAPLIVYSDPAIDPAATPLLPNQERAVASIPWMLVSRAPLGAVLTKQTSRGTSVPAFGEPVAAAGIFSDGSTTGDETLLTRLMLRRGNMLLAVETALETLTGAGQLTIIPRYELIRQFRRMTESVRRWYLPPEQQIGLRVYQPIIGKLMSLPNRQEGSPDPAMSFIAEETAVLRKQRVALSESQPSLADATSLPR